MLALFIVLGSISYLALGLFTTWLIGYLTTFFDGADVPFERFAGFLSTLLWPVLFVAVGPISFIVGVSKAAHAVGSRGYQLRSTK